MTEMDARYDQDTIRKIELINMKIDEINQRRRCVRTTRVEDELDRQELDDYIRGLGLTAEQQRIVDRCNRNNDTPVAGGDWLRFIFMVAGVFIQFYLGYEIYRLFSKASLEPLETAYLGILIVFFAFNLFQMLRYLRIVR